MIHSWSNFFLHPLPLSFSQDDSPLSPFILSLSLFSLSFIIKSRRETCSLPAVHKTRQSHQTLLFLRTDESLSLSLPVPSFTISFRSHQHTIESRLSLSLSYYPSSFEMKHSPYNLLLIFSTPSLLVTFSFCPKKRKSLFIGKTRNIFLLTFLWIPVTSSFSFSFSLSTILSLSLSRLFFSFMDPH